MSSAAEKLKALDEAISRERITERVRAEGWNPEWATPQKLEEVSRILRLEAYDSALPQIVAVVEDAEFISDYHEAHGNESREAAWLMNLREALAALDEALS